MLSICILFLLLVFPMPVHAQEVTARMEVTYTLDESGSARAVHVIELTNATSLAYPKEFVLDLPTSRIANVQVISDEGVAQPFEHGGPADTQLRIIFDDPAVGLGNTTTFEVSYDDLDVSMLTGNVLSLNIPRLVSNEQYETYRVHLYVPVRFGTPEVVSPATYALETDEYYAHLLFEDLSKSSGITALFGSSQVFALSLTYRLENPTVTPIETQVALPPDTPYQRVYLSNLTPEPLHVNIDADGNWIATYGLKAKETLDVSYEAYVETFLEPQYASVLTEDEHAAYLTQQPYWPTQQESLQALAQELKTPEAIYSFITSTFLYDFSRLDTQSTLRYGAGAALESPHAALCMEFSDTFVALARAAGVPARLNAGFAYRENRDIRPLGLVREALHAWPEYYDETRHEWRSVDPTWEVTTNGVDYFNQLDFNHIVFAIYGLSSDAPLPAGMYGGTQDSGVEVSIADVRPQLAYDMEVDLVVPLLSKLGLTNRASITVRNLSNASWHDEAYAVSLAGETMQDGHIRLVPYETGSVPFELASQDSTIGPLTVRYTQSGISKELTTYVYRPVGMVLAGLALAAGLGYFIYRYLHKARSL